MNEHEMRAALEWIEACLLEMHERAGDAPISADEEVRWNEGVTEARRLRTELARIEERRAEVARIGTRTGTPGDGTRNTPVPANRNDPFELLRTGGWGMEPRARRTALVSAILRATDDRMSDYDGDQRAKFERVLKRHARDTQWALNLLARARPAYERAFAKMMMGTPELLDDEERAALVVGTNTQGGYLVPTHLDPTLILTNAGSANIMRQLARQATLSQAQGNTWHGVSTAGVTASFDGEITEVSDDTPGVGTISISTFKAQSLVQASIESFEDIEGLQGDVLMLFGDARDRLEGTNYMTGNGTSAPKGIFTALDASTTYEITSTTAATIGEVDIHAVYKAVGQRWRSRSAWLMAPTYALAIKRLGTAVSSSYSGDLTQPVSDRILGRPVYESDDAPTTQTTTALDNELVFGDFSNFLIVDKPGGMSVEFIPHLFNTANNLPDGRRAWYAHWRTGSDATNPIAFRLLQDKTSA